MPFGLQVMNSDGTVVVDTEKYGLARVIFAQTIVGNGPHAISPANFNRTSSGHLASVVRQDGYNLGYYTIEYPTNTSIKVTGYNGASDQARVLVFAA